MATNCDKNKNKPLKNNSTQEKTEGKTLLKDGYTQIII
jgi:hypothetical protein